MSLANEIPSPPSVMEYVVNFQSGMATPQQREGIRGIPYLQQKSSQHRMDISSPVSW